MQNHIVSQFNFFFFFFHIVKGRSYALTRVDFVLVVNLTIADQVRVDLFIKGP